MKTALILAIFALVVVGFFFDVLLGGKVLLTTRPSLFEPWRTYASEQELTGKTYRTDSMLTYLPRRTELSRSIASGRLPLWNPYILSGMPFFADPQSRVLYPLSLLLALFGAEKALGYDVALHFLLALIGMYLFLRAIDASRAGATLGAFAYGFSSFFATRMGHPTFVASAAWIPCFFYGFEVARRSERVGTLLLAAFLVMGYLAGFPQILVFGVAALVLYAVALAVDQTVCGPRRAGLAHAAASARIIGVSGCLALLVVAVQLVPFREFLRNSEGLGISLEQMKSLYLSKPVLLVRALVPGLFGNPVEGTNWLPLIQHGIHPYNLGLVVYCGVGTLMIALGGLAFLGQSKHLRALLAILVLSVAIGTSGAVLGLVYRAIPFFRYSQIDRISVLACFALAALGGKGLSLFAVSPTRRYRLAFLATAGAVVVTLIAGLTVFAARGEGLVSSLKPLALSGGPYVDAGAERVAAWSAGRLDLWVAYERGQIVHALVLAVVVFGLLLALAWCRGRMTRAAAAVCVLLVAVVGVDGLTAARSYYVSQPGGCVHATEGIKALAGLAGTKGEWRTFNREGAIWAFPPNANEIFGIEALRGRSTLVPRTYAYFLGGGNQESAEGPGSVERPEPGHEVVGLMSARYLVRSGFDPAFASGIFGGIARQPGAVSAIRMPALDGEARVALCQVPGDTLSVDIFIPPGARLDFFVGAPASDGWITFDLNCESPAGRVRFRKDLAPSGTGRWYDKSLDLSSLGGQYPKLTLTAIAAGYPNAAGRKAGESEEDRGQDRGGALTAAWGGFELVLGECRTRPVERGYVVEADSAGIVSLTIASDARDVPLEIGTDSGKILRWVAFPSYLRLRTIKVDMTETPGGSFTVTSDSAFTLVGSHLGWKSSGSAWGDLVYAGDMYIFENPTAIEKAFIVPGKGVRALAEAGWAGGRRPGFGRPDLRCGKVRIVSYEPEKIEMEAMADQDAWLVVQDALYPGWKAFVDGKEQAVLMTDVGTRAVEIAKGNHRVVMEFKPGSLKLGALLTALGLLAGILYAVTPRRAARK